jgi:predicted transcriptional regulator
MSNIANDERQKIAVHLRHTLHWPLDRIARRLGIGQSAVSRLLQRANASHPRRASLPRRRVVRAFSLSRTFNL